MKETLSIIFPGIFFIIIVTFFLFMFLDFFPKKTYTQYEDIGVLCVRIKPWGFEGAKSACYKK